MKAWDIYLETLEKDLGQETVEKWLKSLHVLRFDACNLYLEAKDSFQMIWFEEHVRKKAETSFFNNNQKKIKIHLSLLNANPSNKKGKGAKTAPLVEEKEIRKEFDLIFNTLETDFTIDKTFIPESSLLTYRLLFKVLGIDPESKQALPSKELGAFNPLYLYGKKGTGKTHLLQAATKHLQNEGIKALYTRAETFTEHVISAIRAGEMSLFRQAYREIDVLLVDDIHLFSRKWATQEEFFHTFNTLHMSQKQLILSSECTPQELSFIEPRLISRFEWGIVLPLETFSNEELKTALDMKAKAMDFPLQSKVLDYLIETFKNSSDSLFRALKALILRAHLSHKGKQNMSYQTVSFVRDCLKDLIIEEEKTVLTPEKIIRTIADQYGITPEDILGKAQRREAALPRQVAMYVCRSSLKLPFKKIGDIFGRDHSTVMSSVKLIEESLSEGDAEISPLVNTVLKKMQF